MPIPHQQVIENFVQKGDGGRGTNVVAKEKDGALYSTPPHPWEVRGNGIPLAVRLEDGGFLANGARLNWPSNRHQTLLLRALEESKVPFGVVPLDSVTAAWTDGKIRDWNQAPFSLKDLRKEVEIVVPSVGERWLEV